MRIVEAVNPTSDPGAADADADADADVELLEEVFDEEQAAATNATNTSTITADARWARRFLPVAGAGRALDG